MTFTGVGYPFLKWFSYTKFTGDEGVKHWKPKDGGYALHVTGNAGEWIACLSLAIYAVSFYKEFQKFSVEVCCVENDERETVKNTEYSPIKQSENIEY